MQCVRPPHTRPQDNRAIQFKIIFVQFCWTYLCKYQIVFVQIANMMICFPAMCRTPPTRPLDNWATHVSHPVLYLTSIVLFTARHRISSHHYLNQWHTYQNKYSHLTKFWWTQWFYVIYPWTVNNLPSLTRKAMYKVHFHNAYFDNRYQTISVYMYTNDKGTSVGHCNAL